MNHYCQQFNVYLRDQLCDIVGEAGVGDVEPNLNLVISRQSAIVAHVDTLLDGDEVGGGPRVVRLDEEQPCQRLINCYLIVCVH